MGLTPGRVVTEVRYRPRMNDAERQRLYYTDQDYIMFEHEEMCERAGREMRRIEMRRTESRIRAQRISGSGTGVWPAKRISGEIRGFKNVGPMTGGMVRI